MGFGDQSKLRDCRDWTRVPVIAWAGPILAAVVAVASVRAQEPANDPLQELNRGEQSSASEAPAVALASEPETAEGVTLGAYLDALASRRLIAAETGNVERLRELVSRGEQAYFEQRYDEAALILYEVAESPRFADFVDLEEFAGAEVLLAGALAELGSLRSAARYLERILRRGTEDAYFGPAYRRFVDVALESGDLDGALAQLEASADADTLPEDSKNELTYLRARAAYDAGDVAAASEQLASITRRSRFFASAQYYRGVLAARVGNLNEAEQRFCSIATTEDQERYTFYVDDRFFRVKDLAWLGLGRVAHEGRRSDDAFYYYFQVPNDSERVAEALFESAYAMYEGDDHDTAIDLLDQLEVRAPASPFVDEAMLLRGYVHLGRCEFEEASQLFVKFERRFQPLIAAIDRILESDARQSQLYDELLAEERRLAHVRSQALDDDERAEAARESLASFEGLLLSLLRVDPTFYELHAQLRILDAESARAGRLAADLRGLAARVRGEAPVAAAEQEQYLTEIDELRGQLVTAREMLAGLVRQVDALRGGAAEASDLAPLEASIRQSATTTRALARRLRLAERNSAPATASLSGDESLDALLRRDAQAARQLPQRVIAMRERLVEAASVVALRGLRRLRARLGGELRRARIGRIDAVMGSKRRIEIQIESLAAGRFPPELVDPLRVQGLLRDDEEYWPFEGEYWSDEFDETVALDDDGGGDDGPLEAGE